MGYTGTQRYVAHTTQVSAVEANQQVAAARLITRYELSGKALIHGHINLGHAALLAKAARKHPDAYAEDEGELVAAAAYQNLDDFTDTVARWCNAADLDASSEDPAYRHRNRSVVAQPRLDGSGTGRFDLDAAGFATVMTGLDAMAAKPDAHNAPVQRTLRERRADALVEMSMGYGPEDGEIDSGCECHADCDSDGERADSRVMEPHGRGRGAVIEAVITLNPDGDDIAMADRLSDLHRTGPVPWVIIEQLSCDANWRRVLVGASQILDYSSPTADITPSQRRALRIRDRHCQFEACNRPWHWCDAHHIVSRHDGGPTTLDNLALMCRFHHSLIHQQGWQFGRDPTTGKTWTSSP